MAQTTAALSAKDGYVEISVDGAAAVDISGFSNSIDPGDAGRDSGEAYTFDGDKGIVTFGKRTPLEVKASFVYTEGASDAYKTSEGAFEAGSVVVLAWAPKGNTVGNFMVTSDDGGLSSFMYPKIEASEPGPIMSGFTLRTPGLSVAAIVS
jgi:hypothetical protein